MFTLDSDLQDFNFSLSTLGYSTTDSISQYVSVAGENRDVAQQTADVNRNPMSRRFSEFGVEDASATVELRNLDGYDEFYESDHIYVVVTQFVETAYESMIELDGSSPFTNWEVSKITYRKEIHHKPAVIATLKWERPFVSVGNPPQKQYLNVNEPLVVTFDSNRAVAAQFTQLSDNCVVRMKQTLDEEEEGDLIINPTNRFLCHKRYIQVVCEEPNEVGLLPTRLSVQFYGEPVFTFNIPVDNQYLHTLVHPDNTQFEVKLFPPGKYNSFPSHFWNSGPKPPEFVSYVNRVGDPSLL